MFINYYCYKIKINNKNFQIIQMRTEKPFGKLSSTNNSKQKQTMSCMRQNIQELNRSMQSIEKMIARSRQLINRSRQPSLNSNSIEKRKENFKEKELLFSSIKQQHSTQKYNKTAHRQIDLIKKNSDAPSINQQKTQLLKNQKASNQISFRNNPNLERSLEFKNKPFINKYGNAAKISNKSKQKSDQRTHIDSPFKQIYQNGKNVYKFSPQKTNSSLIVQSKSKQKSTSERSKQSQQKLETKKPKGIKEHSLKIDLSFLSSANTAKQNILIQEQQSQNSSSNQNKQGEKQYRFKTQYTPSPNQDVYSMYKLQESNPNGHFQKEKRKINLKLFESESKKSCLASQRSKKSAYESVRLSTRKNLVKQLGQLETQSTSEEERKAKFIMKIKKYGFVQKHLNEDEIWNIYEQLVQSNIPELKWPIVIVDQVYRKMKLYP